MNKYQNFCQQMINGNIPFRKNFYVLSLDKRSNGSKTNW